MILNPFFSTGSCMDHVLERVRSRLILEYDLNNLFKWHTKGGSVIP